MDTVEINDSIWIRATPARVFKALTNAQELSKWWPKRAASTPKLGGEIQLTWFNGTTLKSNFDEFRARKCVAFAFGKSERARFRLVPKRGGTSLHIEHQCSTKNAIHVAQVWAFLKASLKCWLEHAIDLRDSET